MTCLATNAQAYGEKTFWAFSALIAVPALYCLERNPLFVMPVCKSARRSVSLQERISDDVLLAFIIATRMILEYVFLIPMSGGIAESSALIKFDSAGVLDIFILAGMDDGLATYERISTIMSWRYDQGKDSSEVHASLTILIRKTMKPFTILVNGASIC